MARFAVGDSVVVLAPFGDGAAPLQVVDVQHLNDAGEIVPEPSAAVQYGLTDGTYYAEHWLEAAP